MNDFTISSDLIRGHIDTIILRSLLSGDKYAQLIMDYVEEISNGQYQLNQATLYSSLKRLESLNYVKSYWYDAPDGRRKYFKITDNGVKNVEESLNNWDLSKDLIDKLIGSTKKQSIIYVEKPVTINPLINDNIVEKSEKIDEKNEIIIEKQSVIENKNNENNSEVKNSTLNEDYDFRAVLNELIDTQKRAEKPLINTNENDYIDNDEIQPEEKAVEPKKIGLIDTLSSTDYNSSYQNNGKIDYGDIMFKASNEGFKVKISSKEVNKPKGTLLINKLNFVSSIGYSLLVLLEFLLLLIFFSSKIQLPLITTLVFLGIVVLVPILFLIIYRINPANTSPKIIGKDSILTSLIIVFNLLIIIVASNIIFNVNFNDLNQLILYTLSPISLSLDLVCFFVLRYLLSKKKEYNLKNN